MGRNQKTLISKIYHICETRKEQPEHFLLPLCLVCLQTQTGCALGGPGRPQRRLSASARTQTSGLRKKDNLLKLQKRFLGAFQDDVHMRL